MKSSTLVPARIASGVLALAFMASALPAFADNATSTSNTAGTYNVACVQNAVGAREDATMSALTAYNSAVASALSVRKTEIVAAWAQTNFTARMSALKAAYEKYRAAVKTAHTTLKNAQKAANETFKTAMKNCGVTSADLKGSTKQERKHLRGLGSSFFGGLGLNLGFGHKDN